MAASGSSPSACRTSIHRSAAQFDSSHIRSSPWTRWGSYACGVDIEDLDPHGRGLPRPSAGQPSRSSPWCHSSARVMRSTPKATQALWAVSPSLALDGERGAEVVAVAVARDDRHRVVGAPDGRGALELEHLVLLVGGHGRAQAPEERVVGRDDGHVEPEALQDGDADLEPRVAVLLRGVGRADEDDLVHLEGLHARRVAARLVAEAVARDVEVAPRCGKRPRAHRVDRDGRPPRPGRRRPSRAARTSPCRTRSAGAARRARLLPPVNTWIAPMRSGKDWT